MIEEIYIYILDNIQFFYNTYIKNKNLIVISSLSQNVC